MSETHIRIYIIFLCINIVLMLGGFSTVADDEGNDYGNLAGASYTPGESNDESGITSAINMLRSAIDFFFYGGIIGLLSASGMPIVIQWVIGLPLMVIGMFALLPLVTSGANLARSLIFG